MQNKLLPRDIEKLSYVQKELYIGFPEESKEILLAIKDIRSSNLEEDEIDLLLEDLESSLKSNPIIIEEINRILGFKDKVEEVKEKVHESENKVIIADEPYNVSEEERKSLAESSEVPEEQAKVSTPDLTEEQAKVSTPDLTEEQAEVPTAHSIPCNPPEKEEEVNMKIEDTVDSPKEETKEEPLSEIQEQINQEENFNKADTDKLLKSMIDFIVKNLTVEAYRSFNANSDEEVVRALLKEEGYDV